MFPSGLGSRRERLKAVGPPTGTVTFLFTDIEGSTRLWESAPESMSQALAKHDALLRASINAHGGSVFSTGGDGLAAAFQRAGDAVGAARDAQAALAAEPWPESAPIRVRMGLHTGEVEERGGDYFGPAVNRAARLMAAGHGGQVLCSSVTGGLVDDVMLVDLGEHRLPDLSAPQRIFQVGPGAFPPLRSLNTSSTNLPVVWTDLIGRASDIAELSRLLQGHRLVTLTGTGGVGKTRLALAAAAEAGPLFPDGCWLVELAAVADPEEVARAVALAVGAPVMDARGLARYLGDRRMLIVIDNCEHLLDAAAALVEAVLAAGPEPVVLATSREQLGITGEIAHRVRSLALPDPDADLAEAGAVDSVRLFIERAAAGSGGFILDAENATPVIDICRHLDGIPLAIELAAARVRGQPPSEIAARLGERLGWSRRAQERHRTLQATIDWSHDLLNDDERAVFRRLAVFPASFDLAAARAVVGGDHDVAEHVLRLVDRSLVQYEPADGRYRLLETLRQFAEDRLGEAGETDQAYERHARYFLALAERLGPETLDHRDERARPVLTAELDNLRAMADWCIRSGRWAELAGMAITLSGFLFSAAPADAKRWYGEIVEHAGDLDVLTVADVLGPLAWIAVSHDADADRARALAERSIALARERGHVGSPMAWTTIVQLEFSKGDYQAMAYPCQQARDAAEARGDEVFGCTAMGYAVLMFAGMGDNAAAAAEEGAVLARAERTRHPDAIRGAASIAAVRFISSEQPDFASCLALLSRYERFFLADDSIAVFVEGIFGTAMLGIGRPGAVGHLARSIRIADRLGVMLGMDQSVRQLAIAAARAGFQVDAAALVGYSEANLHAYPRDSPILGWHQALINNVLEGMADRAEYEAAGRAMTRREFMALVSKLDATIDHR
jgi:predicted ATPase/class 3 adenylate cyclase